jgi:hypothetical protein
MVLNLRARRSGFDRLRKSRLANDGEKPAQAKQTIELALDLANGRAPSHRCSNSLRALLKWLRANL